MTAPSSSNPETAAFLNRRFADQIGYLCIGSIDGDPSIKKGKPGYTPLKQEFYAWPKERNEALNRLAYLADETAGNIYASICLYTSKKRSYPTAIPTNWLWADDIDPDAFDWTECIETSDGNYQGGIQVDQRLTAEVRRDLVKRLRLHLGHSDACSADPIHLWRVVGGFNSKGHNHFPVAVDTMGGKVWSLAELDALLPPLPTVSTRTAATNGTPIEVDSDFWRKVAHHLHNIDALLASGRIAAIKPETQAGRILGDDLSRFLTPEGDEDRSTNAFILAYGLRLRGFPDEEIAAIVFEKYRQWGMIRQKGSAWAPRDILDRGEDSILMKLWQRLPITATSPTHYRATGTTTSLPYTSASRARKDRIQRIDAAGVYTWYRQQAGESGVVMQTRTEIAASLCISVPTLDRLDAILRSQGLIERRTERAGGANYSYVIICDTAHQEAVHDDDSTPLAVAAVETAEGVLSPCDTDQPPSASQSVAADSNAVPIRSNTTLSLLAGSPEPLTEPPSPAAIAMALTWLRTLRPWQIEKMVSFATTDELLTWLDCRTPDDIVVAAVVIAVQRWSLEPAVVVIESPPVATEPERKVCSVTPKTNQYRPIISKIAADPRRTWRADPLTDVDYRVLSAVLEGIEVPHARV